MRMATEIAEVCEDAADHAGIARCHTGGTALPAAEPGRYAATGYSTSAVRDRATAADAGGSGDGGAGGGGAVGDAVVAEDAAADDGVFSSWDSQVVEDVPVAVLELTFAPEVRPQIWLQMIFARDLVFLAWWSVEPRRPSSVIPWE